MKNYQTLADFRKLERINEKTTRSDCKREFRVYRISLNLCSEIVGNIIDSSLRKDFTFSQFASLLILFRLIGAMRSMEILCLRGYYYEASLLKRSFFEGLGLCIYLSECDEEAQKWLRNERIKVTSIKLINYLSKFIEFVSEEKDVWNVIYGMLCNYVHSNVPAVVSVLDLQSSQIMKDESGKISTKAKLVMPSNYDKTEAVSVCILPVIFFSISSKIFEDEISKDTKRKMIKKATSISKIIKQDRFTFKF